MSRNLKNVGRCARCLRRARAEVVYVADPSRGPVTRKLCAAHLATVTRAKTPVQVRSALGGRSDDGVRA